tara:strand:- start:1062 stop:1358 length:297 start_codon:yes stop_codon:yes gene_type:complete
MEQSRPITGRAPAQRVNSSLPYRMSLPMPIGQHKSGWLMERYGVAVDAAIHAPVLRTEMMNVIIMRISYLQRARSQVTASEKRPVSLMVKAQVKLRPM